MDTIKKEKARFDTRLPKEQKQFFERAAIIGGYRNLTDFVIKTVQNQARKIMDERSQILNTERDAIVFFDALANPASPNKELIAAAKEYKKLHSE